ncbi:mRNA splicing protein, partial [Tulasnella sp. 417]
PLFHGSSAAAAIYKSHGNSGEGNDELYGGGTEEGVTNALSSDRFGLGPTKLGKGLGYEGGPGAEGPSEGPVQFEKDVSINPTDDVFGVGQFLDEAKRGVKRGLDTTV